LSRRVRGYLLSKSTTSTTIEELTDMSATDKIKNAIEDAEGKAKEALGKVTGDKSTENEGKGDQAKSDLKNAGENVKDAFKH
jgi:uncharacterized protein YjbJ (UPF0337 family)